MRLGKLTLSNFRNIEGLELGGFGDATVLVGENAQGKTNILEAIYLCASGKSFRTNREEFLIKSNEKEAYVFVELKNKDADTHVVRVVWQYDGKNINKTIQIDGNKSSRMGLMNLFPAVIFSPEDIDLLRLSPSHRRRFMDLLIGRSNAEYRSDLLEYTRVRRQRNQLLLLVKQRRVDEDELDVWDEKLAEVGARLVQKRSEAINAIKPIVSEKYRLISSKDSVLKTAYNPSIGVKTKREYLEALASKRHIDIARATTTAGIHRDDVVFILNNHDVRYTASRGEFRSVVLALKLAEADYLKRTLDEMPVVLLDDGFSELDEKRKQALVYELKDYQVLVTTNNEYLKKLFDVVDEYVVEEGRVKVYT